MDRLRAEGFIEEDRYIVSKQDNQYSMHRGFSDYDNAPTSYDATDAARTEEEQLHVDKKRVQTGEVDVEKYVVEDQQTIEVPVEREEIYIERRPVNKEATLHANDVTDQAHACQLPPA